jgi:hypothetical protein
MRAFSPKHNMHLLNEGGKEGKMEVFCREREGGRLMGSR